VFHHLFYVHIVTRATTGERKPNGSLPKLRGVPYEIWGCKNKINKLLLIRREEKNIWSPVPILSLFNI